MLSKHSVTDDELYSNVDTGGRLIEEEKMEVGSIPCKTYKAYIKSAGGYILAAFVLSMFTVNVVGSGTIIFRFHERIQCCLTYVSFHVPSAMSSWWLAHWLNTGVVVSICCLRYNCIFHRFKQEFSQIDIHRMPRGQLAMKLNITRVYEAIRIFITTN